MTPNSMEEHSEHCNKTLPDGSICRVKLDCHLCDWRQKEQINLALEAQREELKKQVKELCKNLVVDNWEDSKTAHRCNPRCHDSGKEDMANNVLALLNSTKI